MKKNYLVMLLLVLLLTVFSQKSVYCDPIEKSVELSKEYSFVTFTVSSEEDDLSECTGSVISPNGGSYALSYIDGYLVTTIDKVNKGTWTIVVNPATEEVPKISVSIQTKNLINNGGTIVDTTIVKKVTDINAFMEDDVINVNWTKSKDETVIVTFMDASSSEVLYSDQNADGHVEYTVPDTSEKVIVQCVYYRYRDYDNAMTTYIFDKNELPVAEINFGCPEKTNAVIAQCNINTDSSYVIYNNGDATKNSINLSEGVNHIIIKVSNDKGYTKTYEYTLLKDTKAPVLTLDADLNRTSTYDEKIMISGTITDAVKLMVQGNYVTFNDEGRFETIVSFELGQNELVIKATDDTGNVTEYIAYITRLEEESGINPVLIVGIISIVVIIGIVFLGKAQFKRNLSKELKKKDQKFQNTNKELEEERYKATHDELTKCKNRTAYMQDIKTISLNNVCIINFDVNNLKQTNDTLGHQSGDKLLLTIADVIKSKFENVYRMGGDEFTVLTDRFSFDVDVLLDIDDELRAKTESDLDNIIYEVAYGYDFGDGTKTEKEIYSNADKQMYEDKKAKKKAHADVKEESANNTEVNLSQIDELLDKHNKKIAQQTAVVTNSSEITVEEIVDTRRNERRKRVRKGLLSSIVTNIPYIVLLVIVYVLLNHVYFIGNIESESMYPTFKVGDVVIGSRLYYGKNDFERGDEIFFKHDGKYLGKRVVGLSDDKITFKNGYVVINGEICKEEYLDEDVETNGVDTFIVPEDSLFVLGDNRDNSLDSRYWEYPYVAKSDVVCKVYVVIPQKYAKVLKIGFMGFIGIIFILLVVSAITNHKKE